MNQQQKEQWLAALRSGRYQKGVARLRTQDGAYCCLGVANEIFDLQSISSMYLRNADGDSYFLPSETQQLLGDMNDFGKSFAEIADYIEQNVPPTE